VKVGVPIGARLVLEIGEEPGDAGDSPTARLQKGMLLLDGGESLAEEGVGFGVPILKRSMRTVFPGRRDVACRRDGSTWKVTATYEMDLVERLAKARGRSGPRTPGPDERLVRSRTLYAAKDALAALHRRFPALRRPLAATSTGVRRAFGWVTTYEQTESCGTIAVTHVVRPGERGGGGDGGAEDGGAVETRVAVTVDLTRLTGAGITEVVVMNEQGARCFERYEDSDGAVLRGAGIGTWDEVGAARASFVSTGHRVAFSLGQTPGARLFRGRELVGARLAWVGFGYSLPPTRGSFGYHLSITSTP
jgi:hypothetical protein